MPIYEYACGACGEEHEFIQKMGASALRKCPACGALKLRRKISRSAFHLKGEGWYVTDYAANGKKEDAAKQGEAADAKSDAKSAEKADKKETTAKNGAAPKESKKKEAAAVA